MKLRNRLCIAGAILTISAAALLIGMSVREHAGSPTEFLPSGSSLPDITERGKRLVVIVPALPEEGFKWPYVLAIPGNRTRKANENHNRFLLVDTNNTRTDLNDYEKMLSMTKAEIMKRGQFSMRVADDLWMPMLMPAFLRPNVKYTVEGEKNVVYTHALDRDTARLALMMKDPGTAEIISQAFRNAGQEADAFLNLDLQLCAMIDHAVAYLNRYGHGVETGKVFLCGYSASGTFVDRFALLRPDRVKAVATGATLDDMVLPLAELGEDRLIFPIGTFDYREITGRAFDLGAHNRIARLVFMGEKDSNNTVPYNDGYGDREREIILRLWGIEVQPRARALVREYGQSGGKGIFIFDKGIRHSSSPSMRDYVRTFFMANRDGEAPVYPLPADPDQLNYTLFE